MDLQNEKFESFQQALDDLTNKHKDELPKNVHLKDVYTVIQQGGRIGLINISDVIISPPLHQLVVSAFQRIHKPEN